MPTPSGMLGFSGTRRNLTHPEQAVITDFLYGLDGWDGFVTGGCIGIDHFAAWVLVHLFPEKRHVVIVPANRSRVAAWWRRVDNGARVEVIEMPPDTDYRDRNIRLVDECSWLTGIPEFTEHHPRSQRSGTWQTIRLARTAALDGRHIANPLAIPLSTLGA